MENLQNLQNKYFEFVPMFKNIIGKYKRQYNFDDEIFQDLLQDSYLYYIKAIKEFDPEKNIKLSTYLHKGFEIYVKNKLKKYINMLTGLTRKPIKQNLRVTMPIEYSITTNNINDTDLIINLEETYSYNNYLNNLEFTIEEEIINKVLKENILNLIEKYLTEEEYKLLIDYFIHKKTYSAIAKELNLSKESIRQRINKILSKLRYHLIAK